MTTLINISSSVTQIQAPFGSLSLSLDNGVSQFKVERSENERIKNAHISQQKWEEHRKLTD